MSWSHILTPTREGTHRVNEILRSPASCFIFRGVEYLLLDLVLLLVEHHDRAAVHLREDHQLHFPTPQLSLSQSAKILIYLNSEELREWCEGGGGGRREMT